MQWNFTTSTSQNSTTDLYNYVNNLTQNLYTNQAVETPWHALTASNFLTLVTNQTNTTGLWNSQREDDSRNFMTADEQERFLYESVDSLPENIRVRYFLFYGDYKKFPLETFRKYEDEIASFPILWSSYKSIRFAVDHGIDFEEDKEVQKIWISTNDKRIETEMARFEASQKARLLLMDWLDEEQLEMYRDKGYFEVVGEATGRRYRIKYGRVANVIGLNSDGTFEFTLCAAPDSTMPEEDVMLIQKMWLETDEMAFLIVANHQEQGSDTPPVTEQALRRCGWRTDPAEQELFQVRSIA